MHWVVTIAAIFLELGVIIALPPSLVKDVKANELKLNNKVKRAFSDESAAEDHKKLSTYSSAIKRGGSRLFSDWQQDKNTNNLSDLPSDSIDYSQYDVEPYLSELEKNYRNAEREKAIENAILKSELYGDSYPNAYKYYEDQFEERKRKRRETKIRMGNRYKRNVDLTPEEWLLLLQIWENEKRRQQKENYHPIWSHYEPTQDKEREKDEYNFGDDDENWLEAPAYPHVSRMGSYPENNHNNMVAEDKRGQWDGFSENKKKRFLNSDRKNDPSRELRYLNGPARSKNEFYTLSQLLANQREPEAPIYRRMVL